jgi:uncharacterized DUF497 family protein
MKPIILMFHAASERMPKFRLERTWVENAVRYPDWVEPDPQPGVERRYRVTAELGGRVLRVVCVEEEDHIRVISVFPDRNAKRRYDRQNDPRSRS